MEHTGVPNPGEALIQPSNVLIETAERDGWLESRRRCDVSAVLRGSPHGGERSGGAYRELCALELEGQLCRHVRGWEGRLGPAGMDPSPF